MCWAESSCTCSATGTKCPYACTACGRRLRGALGHGPACECPDRRLTALAVTLARAGEASTKK